MELQKKHVLALDQGTTSSRAILFNHAGEIVTVAQKPFEQIFPKPGWVEHDANEIWSTQSSVAAEAIAKAGLSGNNIACIGITNQRETTVVWNRETSQPIYNAIVWQDRRTADYCQSLKASGHTQMIQEKTGLVIDAYFSATKIKWVLDNVQGARQLAKEGKLAFGTIDSWLAWKLTFGKVHITDVSNASRTMLFNIHNLQWDKDLLKLFDIPESMLPEVKSSSEIYCETSTTLFSSKIPLSGIAGDQQAALFGQLCVKEGMAKTTYGTGCFLMMNTGQKPIISKNNLLTTIAWKIGKETHYALEGSVFVGGAVIQWLRDGLQLFSNSAESEALATSVSDNGGVYFVPALTGLGAPYWDQFARGTIVGITRGTTRAHITRAALEGIAFQVNDVLKAMAEDKGNHAPEMRVDGGAVANNFLMQFQANIGQGKVVRPNVLETTALGAAYLAGLAVGFWENTDELQKQCSINQTFYPNLNDAEVKRLLHFWKKAITRSQAWEE